MINTSSIWWDLLAALLSLLLASIPKAAAQSNEVSPKDALRFHTLLQNRPFSDTLFERFQEAWLEETDAASLEKFLTARSEAGEATLGDHCLLARFLTGQKREQEALKLLEDELREGEGPAEAWVERAELRARLSDFPKALADLEQAAGREPEAETALKIGQLRGKYLLRTGRIEEALGAWKGLIEQFPDDEELREDLIDLLESEGQIEEAVKMARSLVEQTPDPYDKLLRRLRLAALIDRAGDEAGAIGEYAVVLRSAGGDSFLEREAITRTEALFRRDQDVGGWLKQVEDWIKAEPNRLALRIEAAGLLAELDRDEEAVAAWKDVLERTPGDIGVRVAYVDALGSMEKYPEAIEQAKILLAGNRGPSAELEFTLAGLYAGNDEPDEAVEALRRFRENENRAETSYFRSLDFLKSSGLEDRSRDVFVEGRERWPNSLALDERWAIFLYDAGEKESAKEVWRRIAKVGGRALVVRIADLLIAREEGKAALDILEPRLDEFDNDPDFLTALCRAALQAGEAERAMGWARSRVNLSRDEPDLARSVTLAAQIARVGGTAESESQALTERGDARTAPERRLLAQLREDLGWSVFARRAQSLIGETDIEKAESLLRGIVRRFPENRELRRLQAESFFAQGSLAEARELYWQLVEDSGDLVRQVEVARRLAFMAAAEDRRAEFLGRLMERHRREPDSFFPVLTIVQAHRDWVAGDWESAESIALRLQLRSAIPPSGEANQVLKPQDFLTAFADERAQRWFRLWSIKADIPAFNLAATPTIDPEVARLMESITRLWTGDAREFETALRELEAQWTIPVPLPLSLALEAWSIRGNLDFDFRSVVTSRVERNLASEGTTLVDLAYVFERVARRDADAGLQLLDDLEALLLGPSESRADLVRTHYSNGSVGDAPLGSPGHRIGIFMSMLIRAEDLPDSFWFPATKAVLESGLHRATGNAFFQPLSKFNRDMKLACWRSTEQGIAALESLARGSADLSAFRATPIERVGRYVTVEQDTLEGYILEMMRTLFEDGRPPYEAWAREQDGDGFGFALLRAALLERDRDDMAKVFVKYEAQIRSLDADRLRRLSMLAKDVGGSKPGGLTPSEGEFWTWLMLQSDRARGEREEFLNTASGAPIGRELPELVSKLVADAGPDQPGAARQILEHALTLVEPSGRGAVLNAAMTGSPELFPLWTEFSSRPELRGVGFNYREAATRYAESVPASLQNAGLDPMKLLKELYGRYADALGDQDPVNMDEVVVHQWLTSTAKGADLREVADWAASSEASDRNPHLAATLRALGLMRAGKEGVPAEAASLFIARLTDETRSLQSRMAMGWFLRENYSGWPPAFHRAGVDLIARSWEEGGAEPTPERVNATLRDFRQQPMDAEWRETSERFESAFRRKYPRAEGQELPKQRLDELLAWTLRRGDYEFVGELITSYAGSSFRTNTSTTYNTYFEPTTPFVQLVRAGQHETAAILLRRSAYVFRSVPEDLAWDDALRTQVPLFLATLTLPDERILAELVLARIPGLGAEEVGRRFIAAAGMFRDRFDAAPASPAGRQAMLILAGRPESRKVIGELLHQEVSQLDMGAAVRSFRGDRGFLTGSGGLKAVVRLDVEIGLFQAAIRQAALEGSLDRFLQCYAIFQKQCPRSSVDYLRIDELGKALTGPYEEWRTAGLSGEELSKAWPIMRFISLQKLPARSYNKSVPKPDDTLRRFLAMTFAADRVAELAAWEPEWLAVWGQETFGKPRKSLKGLFEKLLREPGECASMLKEAKALCPDRTAEEWAALMEKWAANPWLSTRTAVFKTNGPQILRDAGLIKVVETPTDSDVPK